MFWSRCINGEHRIKGAKCPAKLKQGQPLSGHQDIVMCKKHYASNYSYECQIILSCKVVNYKPVLQFLPFTQMLSKIQIYCH